MHLINRSGWFPSTVTNCIFCSVLFVIKMHLIHCPGDLGGQNGRQMQGKYKGRHEGDLDD